jgi:glycosyltransferase involved in cell wall biosynthesis
MKPLLSIIIPVYNVEKYIEACLNSVIKQLPDWVEVVIVDDGSPDGSMDIVRESFCQWITSGRISLLEQSNKGPGAARNTGIRESCGEFIGFLDSDDVILDGYFDEVADSLRRCTVDIVEFGFKRFKKLENISDEPYKPLYEFEGLKKLDDVREEVFSAGCWYPSTRIYRAEMIKSYPFPEDTHYEDLMTIPLVYLEEMAVFFIDKPLLGYRYNPSSITSQHTARQLSEKFGFYKSIRLDAGCDATKILKIKTARGMVFFHSELNVPDFPINEVIAEIGKMRLSPTARGKLLLPDRLFYHFPALYALIDRIRVPLKTLLSKFK